jgi:hypothetical protein
LAVAAAPAQAGPDAISITPSGGNGASVSWTNNGSTTENAIAIGPKDFSSNSLTSLAFPGASSCAPGSQGGWYCYVNLGPGGTIVGSFATVQAITSGLPFVNCTTTDSFATDACQTVAATAPVTNANFAQVTNTRRYIQIKDTGVQIPLDDVLDLDPISVMKIFTELDKGVDAAVGFPKAPTHLLRDAGAHGSSSAPGQGRAQSGTASTQLKYRQKVTLFLKLTKAGAKALKQSKTLTLNIVIKLSDAAGHHKTVHQKVTLKKK